MHKINKILKLAFSTITMIQRVQSIFLFLASLFFGGQFLVPFASSTKSITGFLSDLKYDIFDNPILLAITGIGAIFCLASIFLFKNRPLQMKLAYLGIVFSILLPLTAVILFINNSSHISEQSHLNDQVGLYLPIGSLLCLGLALRFIKKDDKLVKSMDRLR